MNISAVICRVSSIRVWGLTPEERARRCLERLGVPIVSPEEASSSSDSVVLLRADHVYDNRVLNALVAEPGLALRRTDTPPQPVVAAHVSPDLVPRATEWLESDATDIDPGIRIVSSNMLVDSASMDLRKVQRAFVLELTEENRGPIERYLYDDAYKGVTDCVTKFLWPVPARWAVHLCTRLGLRPNHVTGFGFCLMLLALVLFERGIFGWGLAAGWVMTFLDTVDGKLARTTLTSSRFGHYLDKVTDIVHPPFWYLAWAAGLGSFVSPTPELALPSVMWAIFFFYILGRLAEALASRVLVAGGIFVWKPLDSFFRLVTARRNTCLPLLTLGAAIDRPDLGLWLVCVWTAATTLFLAARLVVAGIARSGNTGPLRSWLTDVDMTATDAPLAVRLFAQRLELRP